MAGVSLSEGVKVDTPQGFANNTQNMNKGFKIVITSVFFTAFFAAECFAAPLPPASGTPLDPVSLVLLGAAGALAGKKYYDSKKEKE
ncbi:MAG: hypothetical protein SH857_18805 [Chitinophagales bacterium]|nr:hypothetical protein [Chitinophagales bacterium]